MSKRVGVLAVIGLLVCAAAVGQIRKEVVQNTKPTAVSGPGKVALGGLRYWDLKEGTGEKASAGQDIRVHYTGWLANGKKFDSSLDRGQPFKFALGRGQVIKGWDEGIPGMKVGGKRQLQIPADLAYGDRGYGASIPPRADLIFEIELISVK